MLFKRISLLNNKYKILYLPIEIYTREFHSKIYLAHEAAQRGWTVLIGPKYDINSMMKYLPKGIYSGIGFHKSAALGINDKSYWDSFTHQPSLSHTPGGRA